MLGSGFTGMRTIFIRNLTVIFVLFIELCPFIGASNPAAWTSWREDFPCTVTCGSGYAERSRQCSSGNPRDCNGAPWEVYQCHMPRCKPDELISTTMTSTRNAINSKTFPAITTSYSGSTTVFVPTLTALNNTNPLPSTHKPTLSTLDSTTPGVDLTSILTTKRTSTLGGHTIAPEPRMCAQCIGSMDECEVLYYPMSCDPPNNYCINRVVNRSDGSRFVNRTCGDFNTCYNDWYHGSSDVELCQKFDQRSIVTMDFQCTFCCIHDNCNIPLKPKHEDLYMDL